jgi:hypothetical protein
VSVNGRNSPRIARPTAAAAESASIWRTTAGLSVIAALRPIAHLVTTPTTCGPSCSFASRTTTSSPDTRTTGTSYSAATSALIPVSLRTRPFTVRRSNA